MSAAEALAADVGTVPACEALGIPRATLYRRRRPSAPRPPAPRPKPARALAAPERAAVLETLNSDRFADKAPAEIYATLLDEGRFLCSTRTMYRILDEEGQVRERRNQLRHPTYKKPELLATGPNQLWSWDITKLRAGEKSSHFSLYVILDVFSRRVVGWLVATGESSLLAAYVIG